MGLDRSRNAIRRMRVGELKNIPGGLFEACQGKPLIVEGLSQSLPPLSLDDAAHLFRGETIWAVNRETQLHEERTAEEFFSGILAGNTTYNAVDHYLVGTRMEGRIPYPELVNDDWLADSGAEAFAGRAQSLVASSVGSYTPLHVDSYGLSGWMYLHEGRKEWVAYPPHCRAALYDALFKEWYDERRAHAGDPCGEYAKRFPLAGHVAGERLTGTLHAGELFFFPGGWIHGVETPETSFGIGGSLLNAYDVVDAMRTWLYERSMGEAGSGDLRALLLGRLTGITAAEGFRNGGQNLPRMERDQLAIKTALQLCEQWESRMASLDTL